MASLSLPVSSKSTNLSSIISHPRVQEWVHHLDTNPRALQYLYGLEYIPSSLLVPIFTNQLLKKSDKISTRDRHLLVRRDITDRLVSAAIWFLDYYGGIKLGDFLAERIFHLQKGRNLLGFGLSVVLNVVTYGLIEPFIFNKAYIGWASLNRTKSTAEFANHPGQGTFLKNRKLLLTTEASQRFKPFIDSNQHTTDLEAL